jgi:hypothetical protein
MIAKTEISLIRFQIIHIFSLMDLKRSKTKTIRFCKDIMMIIRKEQENKRLNP